MGNFNKDLPDWYKKNLSRLNKKNNEAKPEWEKNLNNEKSGNN